MELLPNVITLSRIFVEKLKHPLHGTPPCTPHMKVPPVERAILKTMSYSAELRWYSAGPGILQNQVIPQNRGIS